MKIIITQNDVDAYNEQYFKEHPKAKKEKISKPQHPSLNWYMTANNMQVNSVKQAWKDLVGLILSKYDLIDYGIEKCHITYTTFFKENRTHDLDNITPKFILDGFVDSGFILKDDCRHILSLTTIGKYDKENPRIEFDIEVLERKGENKYEKDDKN